MELKTTFAESMMDLMEAIKKRYSCRAYADKPVEADKLAFVLEAARLAPSARNVQDWRFVVVTDPDTRRQLQAAAADQEFVGQAPVVIVACSVSSRIMNMCAQPYASINTAIALEHIALAATAQGLATCWIGSFDPHAVRQILHIPSHIAVVELMTLGYPADKGASPKRMKAEEIACKEKWTF
jgi:nitroreductase